MSYIGSKPADAVLETNDIADGVVTNPKLSTGSQQNFRNLIINGGMDIAQRSTSATGLGNGDSGYHTCDRWRFSEEGSPTFEFTQSQSTDVPTGQGFAKSLKMDCTTAQTSLGTQNNLYLTQRFEGQNLQYLKKGTANAESTTLSFWVKSNKTGTYTVVLWDSDNSRNISKSYTIDSASTWEKKTITFAGDTSGALNNDNGRSLDLYFNLTLGSDYTSGTLATSWQSYVASDWGAGQTVNLADSTANEFYITGVQLEAGTTASDFEFLPVDVNKNRCLRYYEVLAQGASQAIGYGGTYVANTLGFNITYTEKRAIPSFDQTSGTNYSRFYNGGSNYLTDISISSMATINRSLCYNTENTISDNSVGWIATFNANAYIALDAEL